MRGECVVTSEWFAKSVVGYWPSTGQPHHGRSAQLSVDENICWGNDSPHSLADPWESLKGHFSFPFAPLQVALTKVTMRALNHLDTKQRSIKALAFCFHSGNELANSWTPVCLANMASHFFRTRSATILFGSTGNGDRARTWPLACVFAMFVFRFDSVSFAKGTAIVVSRLKFYIFTTPRVCGQGRSMCPCWYFCLQPLAAVLDPLGCQCDSFAICTLVEAPSRSSGWIGGRTDSASDQSSCAQW